MSPPNRAVAARATRDQHGPVTLLDAGEFDLCAGDTVLTMVEGVEVAWVVVAAPNQILESAAGTRGTIIGAVTPVDELEDSEVLAILDGHPSAKLPFLGQSVETGEGPGLVTRLDVPAGRVTLQSESGDVSTYTADEVGPGLNVS